MTFAEKVLYHQIHPLKLCTDIAFAVVSLYLFWQHLLWVGLVAHFVPPIVASIFVISFADLTRQRDSAFGGYVRHMMTRTIEAIRLGGDIVSAFGAWYHSVPAIIAGLLIVLLAWLSGLRPTTLSGRR